MTKKCTVCKEDLDLNLFHNNLITSDGKQSQCKSCDKINRRARVFEKKSKLVKELGGKCQKCGYNKCIAALDFHHIDDSKEINVSSLLRHKYEIILEEAKKCILLCANCHREEHYVVTKRTMRKHGEGFQHGTPSMFTHKKCRCDLCRDSWNKYLRDLRARKKLGADGEIGVPTCL